MVSISSVSLQDEQGQILRVNYKKRMIQWTALKQQFTPDLSLGCPWLCQRSHEARILQVSD